MPLLLAQRGHSLLIYRRDTERHRAVVGVNPGNLRDRGGFIAQHSHHFQLCPLQDKLRHVQLDADVLRGSFQPAQQDRRCAVHIQQRLNAVQGHILRFEVANMGVLIRWRGSGPQQVAQPGSDHQKTDRRGDQRPPADASRRGGLWIGKCRQTRLHCLKWRLIQHVGKRPGEILAAFHQFVSSPGEAFVTFQLFFKLLRVGATHLAIYPCHDSVVVIGRCKTVRVQERFSFAGGSASADLASRARAVASRLITVPTGTARVSAASW